MDFAQIIDIIKQVIAFIQDSGIIEKIKEYIPVIIDAIKEYGPVVIEKITEIFSTAA